jgi:hypothetical protein
MTEPRQTLFGMEGKPRVVAGRASCSGYRVAQQDP